MLHARIFLLLLVPVLLITSTCNLISKPSNDKILDNLPKMLGTTNIGTEYWLTVPPCYEDESGGSVANGINIYITSTTNTTVNLEIEVSHIKQSKNIKAYEVAEFHLTTKDGCPWTKGGESKSPGERVWQDAGIHITSSDPILVYVLVFYNYTSDSFLALPVNTLGTSYQVSSYNANVLGTLYMPSLTACVAAYDNTTVKFTVGGNSLTETSGGLKPGNIDTKVLNKGDIMIFASDTYNSDLTGSKWVSDKPIGVVSANFCANVPITNNWCDYIVEMDLPTSTWGKFYPVPIVPGKVKPPLIRIFAKESNTKVYRNGTMLLSLTDPGGVLNKGWAETRLLPIGQTPASTIISSDKPIAVTMYNPGAQEDNNAQLRIDPFSCVISPVEQFVNEVTLSTPDKVNGNNYGNNYLNIIYEKGTINETSFDVNNLEFGHVENGEIIWEQLINFYPGEGEKIPMEKDGISYYAKNIQLTETGVYKIRSIGKFAVYSYGFNPGESYGHPAFLGLKDLDNKDTIPPKPDYYFHQCCGSMHWSKVRDMPEDVMVRSNMGSVTFNSENSYNFKFDYDDFTPGMQQEIEWNIVALDLNKDGRAIITFTDKAGNDTTIDIKYAAYKIETKPDKLDFGIVKKGEEVLRNIDISNYSELYPLTVNKLEFKNINQGFEILDAGLPFTLLPAEKKTITVKFKALASGTFSDTLGLGDTCGIRKYPMVLNAKVGEPVIEASDVNFDTLKLNYNSTKLFTVKNSGNLELKITGYDGNYLTEIKHDLYAATPDNPLKISPGDQVDVHIMFEPTKEGAFSDSIVFKSNAGTNIDNVTYINAVVIKPNAIEDNSVNRNDIQIIPNPAGDYIEINIARCPTSARCWTSQDIRIYNFLGECVNVGVQNLEPLRIDTSNLPPGIYTLRFGTEIKMFVKE
jgi:hypothetical protein